EEGGIFKRDWFEIVPATSVVRDSINNPIHFVLDTAYTDKQENDPTGIMSFFIRDNLMYIVDWHEVWMEFPQLIKHIQEHTQKYQYTANSKVYIEGAASGLS